MFTESRFYPMLTGAELITFVKDNPDLSRTELARAAGYVTTTKKGEERVLVQKLCDALLAAKGVPLAPRGRTGKPARYFTTVHKSQIALIGKVYIQEFGLEPGDELEIVLEEDCIRLVPRAEPAA